MCRLLPAQNFARSTGHALAASEVSHREISGTFGLLLGKTWPQTAKNGLLEARSAPCAHALAKRSHFFRQSGNRVLDFCTLVAKKGWLNSRENTAWPHLTSTAANSPGSRGWGKLESACVRLMRWIVTPLRAPQKREPILNIPAPQA